MSVFTQLLAGAPPQPEQGRSGFGEVFGESQALTLDGGREAVAMVNTTVNRAVSLIATTSAALPVKIVRRGDKSRTEVREPSQRHIWGRPNPETHRVNMWESEYASCLLPGNAYVWKDRAGRFDVAKPWESIHNLWYIAPSRVKTGKTSASRKVFTLDGDTSRGYTDREIMHIPALSTDGVMGLSPLNSLLLPVNLMASGARYSKQFFDVGQRLSGQIKTDQELTQEQADEIVQRWQEKHGGKVSAFGRGAAYEAFALSPEESQAIQTLQHWELRIAQVYGIPPHMLGIVDKSTSWGSGIEQQTIGFVQYTLLAWIVRFEQAIEDELLPPDQEVKIVLSGLLRGDTVQRFGAYRIGIASQFMVPNEARELEDMPPLPGGDTVVEQNKTSPGLDNGGGMPTPEGGREARSYTTGDVDDFVEALYQQLRADHYAERMEADLSQRLAEARCPNDGSLLGKNVRDADLWCRHCKVETSWRDGKLLAVAAA